MIIKNIDFETYLKDNLLNDNYFVMLSFCLTNLDDGHLTNMHDSFDFSKTVALVFQKMFLLELLCFLS